MLISLSHRDVFEFESDDEANIMHNILFQSKFQPSSKELLSNGYWIDKHINMNDHKLDSILQVAHYQLHEGEDEWDVVSGDVWR